MAWHLQFKKTLIVLLNIYGLWNHFVRGCCALENHSYQLNCCGSLIYVYEVGGHHVLSNTFQWWSTSTSKSIEGYVLLDNSQSGPSTPTFVDSSNFSCCFYLKEKLRCVCVSKSNLIDTFYICILWYAYKM